MLKLEEYIAKRKKEDGINEFDKENIAENTKICVNYIFEFFNSYLDEMDEKTFLEDDKIKKFSKRLSEYDDV